MIAALLILFASQTPLPTEQGTSPSVPPDASPDALSAPPPAVAPPPPPSAAPPSDLEPPIIEDVAAASSSPQAAPVITVLMSDRGTGVGTSSIFYRALPTGTWLKAELRGGTSGMFIARLPDGLQISGFDYYIEATDVAGNGPARIGSRELPIRVERATMPTLERLERQRFVEPGPAIHPAFLMLSLSVGVLAGAGAGAYALDLGGTNDRLAGVRSELARTDNSDQRRNDLLVNQAALESAIVGDTVITSVLGVVAAAGLATGIVLVVVSSIE